MGFQCPYCDFILSTKGNRSRHWQNFHTDEIGLPVYHCSLCDFTWRKTSLLEEHMETAHQRFTNCCQSCLLGFNGCHLHVQHTASVHHLTVLGEQVQPRQFSLAKCRRSRHSIGKCTPWSAENVQVNKGRRVR